MAEVDAEALVNAAIARGMRCRSCDRPLGSSPGDDGPNLMCECCARHCPYCGADVQDECEHFLTTTGEIEADSLEPELAIPRFDADAGEYDEDEQDEDGGVPQWSEGQKIATFGRLAFLLPNFDGYFTGDDWTGWDETMLRREILENVAAQVVSLPWAGDWMAASSGTDHFSEDPAAVWREYLDAWSELESCLRLLTALAPEREGPSG